MLSPHRKAIEKVYLLLKSGPLWFYLKVVHMFTTQGEKNPVNTLSSPIHLCVAWFCCARDLREVKEPLATYIT